MATYARRLKAHLFVSTEWHVPAARLILLKAALLINIIIIIIIIIVQAKCSTLHHPTSGVPRRGMKLEPLLIKS